MRTLGISGKYRNAAAAIAVDGALVAAASEDVFARVPGVGYAVTGGFPSAAVTACLERAGLELGDIEEVALVHGEAEDHAANDGEMARALKGVAVRPIDVMDADAVLAAASTPERGAVVVWSTDPASAEIFGRDGHPMAARRRVKGAGAVIASAGRLARLLGLSAADPFGGLDRLSVGGEPEFEADFAASGSVDRAGVRIDPDRLAETAAAIGRSLPGSLADTTTLNERVGRARRALAASFVAATAQLVRGVTEQAADAAGGSGITLGGSLFAHPRLNTELRRLLQASCAVAVVPEPVGRALGAALAGQSNRARIASLALGPAFLEGDIKRTLDNCRLDYVYEPDRARLEMRVSKLLTQGKVIAWFQGPVAFGSRAAGTRSILCDPAGRYARQNVNEYLRQVAVDEPLPVSLATSAADRCLETGSEDLSGVSDRVVAPAWRDRLVSALDWRQAIRVVPPASGTAPQLQALLERHFDRTGVPGLIEVPLAGPGEPVACTPRDAVRTVYSSAIDALVIGGFLLMKDHWLLRSDSE